MTQAELSLQVFGAEGRMQQRYSFLQATNHRNGNYITDI